MKHYVVESPKKRRKVKKTNEESCIQLRSNRTSSKMKLFFRMNTDGILNWQRKNIKFEIMNDTVLHYALCFRFDNEQQRKKRDCLLVFNNEKNHFEEYYCNTVDQKHVDKEVLDYFYEKATENLENTLKTNFMEYTCTKSNHVYFCVVTKHGKMCIFLSEEKMDVFDINPQ